MPKPEHPVLTNIKQAAVLPREAVECLRTGPKDPPRRSEIRNGPGSGRLVVGEVSNKLEVRLRSAPSPAEEPSCERSSRRLSPLAGPSDLDVHAAAAECLQGAHVAFCYATNRGFDARSAVAPLGSKAIIEDDLGTLLEKITAAAKSGDHILVLSNGCFSGIHGSCREILKNETGIGHGYGYCRNTGKQ